MEAGVYDILRKIKDKHGVREFGKVAQKLLGIVLSRLCFQVKERSVQDVDLEAVGNGSRYWLEVKTTTKDAVTIAKKDVNGLRQCELLHGGKSGYAILKVSLLSDWIVASTINVRPGTHRVSRFGTHKILPLHNDVNQLFPSVVIDYGNQILSANKGTVIDLADKLLRRELKNKKDYDEL